MKQIYLDLYLKEFAIDSIFFYHWFSEKAFFYPVNTRSLSLGVETVFRHLQNPAMQFFFNDFLVISVPSWHYVISLMETVGIIMKRLACQLRNAKCCVYSQMQCGMLEWRYP